jgi:hypothetical protein
MRDKNELSKITFAINEIDELNSALKHNFLANQLGARKRKNIFGRVNLKCHKHLFELNDYNTSYLVAHGCSLAQWEQEFFSGIRLCLHRDRCNLSALSPPPPTIIKIPDN